MNKKIIIALVLAGSESAFAEPEPADTLIMPGQELEAVTVTATGPRRVVRLRDNGAVELDGAFLGEQVTMLGTGDPLAVVRTLPSVATSVELQASVCVRGMSTGDNLFTSDNARVISPLHMLGLFSAYNPAYYRRYVFRPGRVPMTEGPLAGGSFAAESGVMPDSILCGSVSAGLIESHGAVRIPLTEGLSAGIGLRHSYLDAIFPDILKLGDSRLKYGFSDLNADVKWKVSQRDVLRLSYFGNRDRMNIESSKKGVKDGELGWRNNAASLSWFRGDAETFVSISDYRSHTDINEGGRELRIPGRMTEYKAAATVPLGPFTVGADVIHRHTSGQNGYGEASSWEYSLSAEGHFALNKHITLTAGLRVAGYHNGSYRLFRPQPRLELSGDLGRGFSAYISGGRRVMFDRLIEESGAGLPMNFRVLAGRQVAPSDVWGVEAGIRGRLGESGIYVGLEVYGRRMLHALEWGGSFINLSSPSYNPLSDIGDGRGYAAGIEVSAMRYIGKVRGRIGYNFGTSKVKIDRYGDSYIPSSCDRPHDLNISLNYNPLRPLTLSASFNYASGTPYTRAKYGYMIDENLICEYFPHNSSRLPAYKRLDLAAAWKITGRGRLSHTFTASVYNATVARNVLFRFPEYSVKDGIRQQESVMKAVIPSITYTLDF